MPFPKPVRIKKNSKALHELYEQARQRDGERCIACGKWVEYGSIPHHIEPKGTGGDDVLDNLVTVCSDPDCVHYQIHHGSLKKAVQILLKRLIA